MPTHWRDLRTPPWVSTSSTTSREVRTPTLILAPAQSPLTPLSDQLFLRTTIPGAQIEIFEGRGHNIYNDEPERCLDRIRRFYAEIESATVR